MTGYAPFRAELLIAQITDETTSVPFDCTGYTHLVAYIISNGTTSSGAVTYEEATYDPTVPGGVGGYGGTWAIIGSAVNPAAADAVVATHFAAGAYHWVRARISTAIGGGGSVTVVLCGQSS